jgi:hypothetical protein
MRLHHEEAYCVVQFNTWITILDTQISIFALAIPPRRNNRRAYLRANLNDQKRLYEFPDLRDFMTIGLHS